MTKKEIKKEIMNLGNKIKQMRQKKNLTQEELADRSELTKGYISQLENDLTSPSIATLCDILDALGSSLSEFFKNEKQERVVFSKDQFIEKASDGMLCQWIIPNAQKNIMEPVLITLEEGKSTEEDMPHEGEEFGYILDGGIKIILDGEEFICKKGESFYYKADKPHKISCTSKKKAVFLWISAPPNF